MGTLSMYLTTIAFEPSMLIQNLVTAICVFLLFEPLPTGKNSWFKLTARFALAVLALEMMNGVWYVLLCKPGSYFLTHMLLLMGYATRKKALPPKQYVVTIILFYSIEMDIIVLSSIIPDILLNLGYPDALEIVLRNLVVITTLVAALYFRRFSILLMGNLTRVSLCYSLLVGLTTVVLAAVYSVHRSEYDFRASAFALLAFAGILVIDLVAYYLNYSMVLAQERAKQLIIENYMVENDKELLRLNQQNLEDMRKIRHDIKNHFAYLEVLLREENYDEAMRYFEQLHENIVPQLSYIDCGNKTVSAILNLGMAKARSQGVSLDYRCMVGTKLPIRDSDLCALMTNLIDNAIEAMALQGQTDGVVEVGLRQKGDSLYLCVINPIDSTLSRKRLLSLQTTKSNSAFHGYGHKIVDGIAARYDGGVNREIRDNRYVVDVVLDMTGEKQSEQEGC